MSLDEIKLRQLMRTEASKKIISESDDEEQLHEGKKKHHTPKFVQHCVAAITGKPESLARIEKDAPKGSDGSPFAICWAKYKKNRRSLAAKHAKGKHHTVKEYESALKKLRSETEEIRGSRPSRSRIVFESVQDPKGPQRAMVRFKPSE